MPRLSRILFPVDFSERCAGTAAAVKALATRCNAKLTLIHIVGAGPASQMPYAGVLDAAQRRELLETSAGAMDRLAARHFDPLPVSRVIEEGDPARVIVDYAHKQKIDLIMMPTHGYGPFRRFLIGSVTGKVLHDALCPVWTSAHRAGARPRAAGAWRRILCAVDSSGAAVPLIRWADWLACGNHAALKLVHVIPALDETSRNRGEVELRRYLGRHARAEFEVLMAKAGRRCQLVLRGGNIPARLAETARQEHADLLIAGRGHLRKRLGRLRTHSLAIVRESPCPVISV